MADLSDVLRSELQQRADSGHLLGGEPMNQLHGILSQELQGLPAIALPGLMDNILANPAYGHFLNPNPPAPKSEGDKMLERAVEAHKAVLERNGGGMRGLHAV